MRKNIFLAFCLMLVCVMSVAGLQLYYAYSSYKVESIAFNRNINEALKEAVDSTKALRRRAVLQKLDKWLSDSTFVSISSYWDPKYSKTVFTVKQVVPTPGEQNEISMSIDHFKDKVDSINPKAKKFFISHMINYVSEQLKEGNGWYYTKKLGDSINKAAWDLPLNKTDLKKQYTLSLSRRNIDLPFLFNDTRELKNSYSTKKVNISLNHNKVLLQATFTNTSLFILKQLRLIIISSTVLVFITLGSFWYIVRLLLSQQKLNEIKDDFISNMTHEIHSPISSVIVTAEALKRYDYDEQSRNNYLDIVLIQSKKLAALTHEILVGAKLDKKGIDLSDTVNIKELLEGVMTDISKKDLIHFTVPEGIIVECNKIHFSRAIANIIDNAFKYNTSAKPCVSINVEIKQNKLIISVADNGPGIQVDYQEKIFEQFYRIPSGNVHNVKGYGLGLSYVQKIVKLHKGDISVRDNIPHGSIFIISIPYET